jgi:hypothetical protein
MSAVYHVQELVPQGTRRDRGAGEFMCDMSVEWSGSGNG